jgi:hypothetical protein
MTSEDRLDRLLAQHFRDEPPMDTNDAAARVLAKLAAPLPAQQRSWRHWPAVLLDWDFAPAWPRLAALASCAALGFAVGVAGQSLSGRGAQMRGDFQLAAALSEPEPISGVLP